MQRLKQTKGFTLIELVIVLAIAALILAAVLLAVGGAQRSQRDSSRKNIAGRVGTAIQNYASNNNGTTAGFTCTAAAYCKGIVDTDTSTQPVAGTSATATSGVRYQLGKDCSGNTTSRSYSIFYWNESSGGSSNCIDNS